MNAPNTETLKEVLRRAKQEVAKVIIGQDDVVDKSLIAIFTGNHALIEGVPGVAKNTVGANAGSCAGMRIRPYTVHPRSHACRHYRDPRL